jgi:hypothetical protein
MAKINFLLIIHLLSYFNMSNLQNSLTPIYYLCLHFLFFVSLYYATIILATCMSLEIYVRFIHISIGKS